jgi:hypothetical protein
MRFVTGNVVPARTEPNDWEFEQFGFLIEFIFFSSEVEFTARTIVLLVR